MVLRPEESPAGRGQRAAGWNSVGHPAKCNKLPCVHWMIWFIGAGEVAHDEERSGIQKFALAVVPVGRSEAQAIHARIELNAKGQGGSVLGMARHLVRRIQQRDQACRSQCIGLAFHMAGKDKYFRPVAEHVAECDAFLDKGDKKAPRACLCKRGRGLCRSDAICVGLYDGSRLHLAVRQGIKCLPVCANCVKVDG